MNRDRIPMSDSHLESTASPNPAGPKSGRSRNVRYLLTSVLIALIWLLLRFPYMLDQPLLRFIGRKRVDPKTLHLGGEFVESNLGIAQEKDGSITVRLIAEQYMFVPHCVLVPANVPVRVRITSADVVHMLDLLGTSYSIEAVPGVVSETKIEAPRPGNYAMPCREFCGTGHFDMRSELVAVPREQFRKMGPEERVSCGTP